MRSLSPRALALLAALGTVPLAACNRGGDDEPAAGEAGDGTSGGEVADGTPPGAPGDGGPDDELPEGDLEREAGSGSGEETAGGGDGESEEETSPWGTPETDTGEALPVRRPLSGSARSAFQQGVSAAERGDNAAAQQAFQQALAADRNAYPAAYSLGVIADRQGQDGRALQFYQQALQIQADYERAIEGIAMVYLRRGEQSRAVSFVEPLADRWIRNLAVQAVFGTVLVLADQPERAITIARRALRRDERYVPAMVVLAKANLRLGRTELAESIIEQAIEVDGNVAELHYLRARMYEAEDLLAPALQAYQRAIELRPAYLEARMAVGAQLLAAGNYQEALSHFRLAAAIAPTQAATRLALGEAYRALRQWAQARSEFDRVIELDPNNAEVHFNLGLLFLAARDDLAPLSVLEALQRSRNEFTRYRDLMGPRLPRDDPSQAYLEELGRRIEREERNIERERERQEREAAEAAEAANPS
ncbi:MAG: tetratricopeptide repeat protein [Sandaracinaceae bacterium]